MERKEPGHVGADIVVGSLMKNLGAALRLRADISPEEPSISMIADRLTAPGIGKDLGANFNQKPLFQRHILAPNAVKSALKTQFCLLHVGKIGIHRCFAEIQRIPDRYHPIDSLEDEKNLLAFARSIQASSPVDSNVYITPSPMPGYPCDVIMAAGCFVEGSTIELSADAPCVEPYTLYMQEDYYEYGKLHYECFIQDC